MFRLQNEYVSSPEKSEGVNARLLRHSKGLSKTSQSSLKLNGFLDKTESRISSDSNSPKENLIEVRRPQKSGPMDHRLYHQNEEMEPNIDLECTKPTRTISVHETYQLGYFDPTSDPGLLERLYVFDFVDGLEVTYPISVTSDALPADLPPLFLEPEYVDQLSTLASNALNQLTSLLNNWVIARQKSQEEYLIWYYVSAHEEAVSLRKQIIQLIDQLVPDGYLEGRLDFHSPLTDRFLAQLAEALTTNTYESAATCSPLDDAVPLVSLCPDPAHCVDALRTQIYRLLRILLPHLRLPQSFRIDRDLEPLLSILHHYNSESG